jgi:16S rRNA (guanine(966)-N(2))-methyltransferase RsmD
MRIIAGRFRSRSLQAPKGHLTRPTLDRTRESLFNMVLSRMDLGGARVLDLFAGTGSLGLEAISRGAAHVTFVETDAKVVRVLEANVAALGVEDETYVLRGDAVAYLERHRGPAYDLILVDPPYRLEQLPEMPALALGHLTPGGLLSVEHDKTLSFDDHPRLETSRKYGRTIVSLFSAPLGDED